jgi:hypothetical protein
MKLLTKAIEKKLLENDNKSVKDTDIVNEKVVVKLFNPSGQATWWVYSMEEDGTCYGVAQMFGRDTREYGYFDINEIKSIKCPPFGLPIERDMYYTPETFGELL